MPTISTRRDDVVDVLHGVRIPDPYRWLENAKSPEVQAWMREQDHVARTWLHALPGREALAKRFGELYYVDSISPPVHRGDRFFYQRRLATKEKGIIYWREGENGEEHVLLDPNTWSKDYSSSLGVWVPSWDGTKVVYARHENNSDEATLYVIDVASGKVSTTDVIPGGKYAQPSWTPDSTGFYYEFLPSGPSIPVDERPGYCEIRFHRLGTDPKTDPLVHPATHDPTTFLAQQLSRDGRWLFVYVQRGWNENDIWYEDLHAQKPEFKLLVVGHDSTYVGQAWKDRFYILTNDGAPMSRVLRVDPAKPARADWQEVVPENPHAALQDVEIVGNHLALSYLKDAASEVELTNLDGTDLKPVKLPGIGSVYAVVGNPDEDAFYLGYSSFTTPGEVWKASASKDEESLWARVKLPVDTSRFTTEQIFYHSKDGTRVPMFLIRAKTTRPDGRVPTILYGYGGFDVSLTPDFRSSIIPWIERGGLYAIANIRGGGEYGRAWHDDGRGAHKQNVFDDFEWAAKWLESSGWTDAGHLGIAGGSNGGLLMGAAMTQTPQLFHAVVCAVPLLDMLRYQLFGSGRTWIPEYGDPAKEADFKVLDAYSPYQHVAKGTKYPALLLLSADADDRVDPMHARKFAARMQWASPTTPVLLRIQKHSGHTGADQVREAIDMSADEYAFFFRELGLKVP